jgi:hypothetical protein
LQNVSGFKVGFKFDSYHGNSHVIGRWRVSVTSEKDRDDLWPVPDGILKLVTIPASDRTEEQKQQLAAHYRANSPKIRQLERELFRLKQRETQLAKPGYTTLIMRERDEPRATHIHLRGDFLAKGKKVTPGVPEIFPSLPSDQPANRLALARWLVDSTNPLTARVTVNRLWERIFGTGIVKTSEDLGKQGEAPSHPELLDWLAPNSCGLRSARRFGSATTPLGREAHYQIDCDFRCVLTSTPVRMKCCSKRSLTTGCCSRPAFPSGW